MEKDKARELIATLERLQQEQIQCLQNLFGVAMKDDAPEIIEISNGSKADETFGMIEDGSTKSADPKTTPAPSASQAVTVEGPSQENIVQIPDDWAMAWSNALLSKRIEERAQGPGCGGGMRRELADVDPTDAGTRFIVTNALNDLAQYTFKREYKSIKGSNEDQTAFYVIDLDQNRDTILDTRHCSDPLVGSRTESEVLRALFKQRTPEESLERVIVINAFSPNHDYATIYAALRRHISTSHTDRHYYENHGWRSGSTSRNMAAFTIPYFSLTENPPAADSAPLSPSGVFGLDAVNGKYIREEKFSVSWTRDEGTGKACLMVVLSPLVQYMDYPVVKYFEKTKLKGPGISWVRNNLFWIVHKWGEVLDALDTQTTLPSSITFNNEARQGILFEDRNFSNSKRYFWALQSLRLFAEHIEGTLRSLDGIIFCARDFDGSSGSPEDRERRKQIMAEFQEKFGTLRDRIERKRQEVQSLSDGLFSASSVAEGRLAAEQNGNIRLLTMVTIAYLPLGLASSIYGMDALPSSANIISYIVVTILMSAITYILVYYLKEVKDAISRGRSSVHRILLAKKEHTQESAKDYTTSIAAKRGSTMA